MLKPVYNVHDQEFIRMHYNSDFSMWQMSLTKSAAFTQIWKLWQLNHMNCIISCMELEINRLRKNSKNWPAFVCHSKTTFSFLLTKLVLVNKPWNPRRLVSWIIWGKSALRSPIFKSRMREVKLSIQKIILMFNILGTPKRINWPLLHFKANLFSPDECPKENMTIQKLHHRQL